MIQFLRNFMSPEQRRVIGQEAKQLLENKHFREAFDAVESYLVEKAKACDPTKPGHAENVVISMQLMEALKREIVRKIEDGEMAQIELTELERKKMPIRFYR